MVAVSGRRAASARPARVAPARLPVRALRPARARAASARASSSPAGTCSTSARTSACTPSPPRSCSTAAAACSRSSRTRPRAHSSRRNVALNGRGEHPRPPPRRSRPSRARALLHVPGDTADPSFSSLAGGRFAEGEPVRRAEATTLDAEVEARGLTPAFVKVDVEGAELGVLGRRGSAHARAAGAGSARRGERAERARARADGSTATRASASAERLEPLESGRGLFNALFLPQPPV